MRLAVLLVIINLFFQNIALAAIEERVEYQAVFAHEDVHIKADQTIGRLLVADGNALVDGMVKIGIIVIDGDLTVGPEAHINGIAIILGGKLVMADSNMAIRAWVLPPGQWPMANFIIGGLLLSGFLLIIGLPLAIWLIARLGRDTRIYMSVKEMFLKIQQHWAMLYILAGLFVSGLMLVAFMEIAWETIFGDEMAAFDSAVIWLVRYPASAELDRVMIFITNLGYGYSYMALVVGSFLTVAVYKRWRELSAMAICLAGGALLNYLLKTVFARSRPELFRVVEAAGYSFPSGHAMVSLCFYGMLSYLIIRNIKRWRMCYLVIVFTAILVAAIGISRIYLGVHYPTDVMAGYAAGLMWLALCISLLIWWERK